MRKVILPVLILTSSAFAGTWDLANNFNSSNNPSASSVFSYGWGGSPSAFAALAVDQLDCNGTPTDCRNSGPQSGGTAYVVWNGTGSQISFGTPQVFPGYLNVDPQGTAGVIVRFTAPWTDTYSFSGNFRGDDTGQHTTDALVYHNNTQLGSTVTVSAYNQLYPVSFSNMSLSAGDTIDFLVYSPTGDCCYLSTGVGGTFTSLHDGPTGSSAPEPATLTLIPAGLLLITRRMRRA